MKLRLTVKYEHLYKSVYGNCQVIGIGKSLV